MAFLKKKKDKLPDLPSPPDKYPDISQDEDMGDFPGYTPAVNPDESFSKKPDINPMPIPEFPKESGGVDSGDVHPDHIPDKGHLFIKIDKYETAMSVLHGINEKLEEANSIISELRQIRRDEDEQLDEWSEHIRSVKEKLMNVDTMLFE